MTSLPTRYVPSAGLALIGGIGARMARLTLRVLLVAATMLIVASVPVLGVVSATGTSADVHGCFYDSEIPVWESETTADGLCHNGPHAVEVTGDPIGETPWA